MSQTFRTLRITEAEETALVEIIRYFNDMVLLIMLIAQITTLYVKKSVNLLSGSIVKLPFFLSFIITLECNYVYY